MLNEIMKRYTVDRIVGEFAVCETEDKKIVSLLCSHLPAGIKEGDIIKEESGIYLFDEVETKDRRKEMSKRLENMFEEQEDLDTI